MKKFIVSMMIGMMLLSGCSSSMTIDGKEVPTYGLFTKDEVKVEGIKYKLCWGNIIWGGLLIETVVAPIYFFGFDMFEPVGKK